MIIIYQNDGCLSCFSLMTHDELTWVSVLGWMLPFNQQNPIIKLFTQIILNTSNFKERSVLLEHPLVSNFQPSNRFFNVREKLTGNFYLSFGFFCSAPEQMGETKPHNIKQPLPCLIVCPVFKVWKPLLGLFKNTFITVVKEAVPCLKKTKEKHL